MPNDQPDPEIQRIVRKLSDARRLVQQGASDEWIQSCADLVSEFQRLQEQFKELESQLSRSEGESSQDTLLL
jgi:hypothetical protein